MNFFHYPCSGGKGGRSGTQMDRLAPMMLTPVPVTADHAGVSEADVDALRHQLRQTQNELEDERRKTDWLYQAFLPSTTAAQILNGQQPDAGNIMMHYGTQKLLPLVKSSNLI